MLVYTILFCVINFNVKCVGNWIFTNQFHSSFQRDFTVQSPTEVGDIQRCNIHSFFCAVLPLYGRELQ